MRRWSEPHFDSFKPHTLPIFQKKEGNFFCRVGVGRGCIRDSSFICKRMCCPCDFIERKDIHNSIHEHHVFGLKRVDYWFTGVEVETRILAYLQAYILLMSSSIIRRFMKLNFQRIDWESLKQIRVTMIEFSRKSESSIHFLQLQF